MSIISICRRFNVLRNAAHQKSSTPHNHGALFTNVLAYVVTGRSVDMVKGALLIDALYTSNLVANVV